jgi:O-methyltransferase involved in polyketide biosynthesis
MEDYNKISPTAKLAAYWKAQSDIPYVKEIADLIGAREAARQLEENLDSPMALFPIPVIEARYKSINVAIDKSGLTNVLELASGLSPRGLEIAAGNGTYMGTDLPDISKETFPVIQEIAEREGISEDRLHLQPVNALDKEQLKEACDYFEGRPLAICNEGLMMYLDNQEKATVAQNIREVLLHTGGKWITTDLAFHETMFENIDPDAFGGALKENVEARLGKVSDATGRDFRDNWFDSSSEAVEFYKDCGFIIQELPMYDGSYELSTLSLIGDEAKEGFLEALSAMKVWTLEVEK